MAFWNKKVEKTVAPREVAHSMGNYALTYELTPEGAKYELTTETQQLSIAPVYSNSVAPARLNLSIKVTRIRALMDLPLHGVKAGDLGGWVSSKNMLSHQGQSWIGKDAVVVGNTFISQNALITDKAIVFAAHTKEIRINGNVIVRGNAKISNENTYPYDAYDTAISANALIEGNAQIINASTITDNAIISEYAVISREANVRDNARVYGYALIEEKSNIYGYTIVFGRTKVGGGSSIGGTSRIGNKNLSEELLISSSSTIINQTCTSWNRFTDNSNETMLKAPPVREVIVYRDVPVVQELPFIVPQEAIGLEKIVMNAATKELTPSEQVNNLYKELCDNIDSYQNDIVKIITYPTMVDKSQPATLDMFIALNAAKRFNPTNEPEHFANAVYELEKKYLIAESYAQKVAGSLFTPDEKKKVKKAQDLISIAMNEASAEQEKRVAVKQTLNQLEGVIPLAKNAINNFYGQVGLREIEA